MRRLILGGLGVALAYAVVQNIPEMKRYMRIRSM